MSNILERMTFLKDVREPENCGIYVVFIIFYTDLYYKMFLAFKKNMLVTYSSDISHLKEKQITRILLFSGFHCIPMNKKRQIILW